jgi:hypothetical protein
MAVELQASWMRSGGSWFREVCVVLVLAVELQRHERGAVSVQLLRRETVGRDRARAGVGQHAVEAQVRC